MSTSPADMAKSKSAHIDILRSSGKLAKVVTDKQFAADRTLPKRYGEEGKKKCREDAVYNLEFLAVAMEMDRPTMYAKYMVWAASMLRSRNIPTSDLLQNLEHIKAALEKILGSAALTAALPYLDLAAESVKENQEDPELHRQIPNPFLGMAEEYLELLLAGKRQRASSLVHRLVKAGVSIQDVYEHIFQYSQYEVGRRWQRNEVSVSHEHYCTAATQFIMATLFSKVKPPQQQEKVIVVCSVAGDRHELGVRMVADHFEMAGWDTYYLGADMPNRQLQDSLVERKADILALSVTLPTHLGRLSALIADIRKREELSNLKVLVGGYPFIANEDLWKKVGADGYAQSASQALVVAERLITPKTV